MTTTYRLEDVSIIIPVRIDHVDRLANLATLLHYFERFFRDMELFVVEAGEIPRCDDIARKSGCRYEFFYETGPFPKARLVNHAVRQTSREIVAMHDADVLFRPEALFTMVRMFRSRPDCHYGIPYNGVFLDVNEPTRSRLMQSLDVSEVPLVSVGTLYREYAPGVVCINPVSVGGANYFRRETFLRLGGFNEKFLSCVWEDYEIEARFVKMGFPASFIRDANAIHLHHTRVSDKETNQFEIANRKEYERVCAMDKAALDRYIREELHGQGIDG